MKRPVTFYSEGCKLVGDMYYPDDLRPGEKHAGIGLCHGYTGVKDLYFLIIRGSGTRHTFRHAQVCQIQCPIYPRSIIHAVEIQFACRVRA